MKSFSLLPRQDNFFTALLSLSALAAKCSRHLKNYVENPDAAARKKIGAEITACRIEASAVSNTTTEELCRSFITPFDREDIQNFSRNLYRVAKMIEKVTQRLELHGMAGGRKDFIRQVDLIVDEAQAMEDIVADLIHKRNSKQIVGKVALLKELEQKGDDILQELLVSLFSDGQDVRDILLRKDIYDMLEKVIDFYRYTAAIALQIVLKYS